MAHTPGGMLGQEEQIVSAPRFRIFIPLWSTGLAFSKLGGFNSSVETSEYSFNGIFGNTLAKQIGRTRSPSITLERALETQRTRASGLPGMTGFKPLLSWHLLARSNLPMAKAPCALFSILDAYANPALILNLEMAWCSKLELDAVQAGASNIVNLRVTIECDSIQMS